MKNRLNLLFYFCSLITLLILALPVKYRLAYFAPTLLGYIYLFTLLATILLIIYLSYKDIKNKNSFFKRLLFFIGFVILFIVIWMYRSKHTIKYIIFIISVFFITSSCEKKPIKNREIQALKIENNKLRNDIILLTSKVQHYQEFENNFENEFKVSPDSTISIYNKILQETSNSVLKELIQLRINEIKKNKRFWNEVDGWKISKDGILLKPKVGLEKIRCK